MYTRIAHDGSLYIYLFIYKVPYHLHLPAKNLHIFLRLHHSNSAPLVVSVLASLIERALSKNERLLKKKKTTGGSGSSSRHPKARVFDCDVTPALTVESFLERIFRYTRAGPSVYVVAYVYIDRFSRVNPEFRVGPRNVHRLLLTTIMVASKYVEDMNYRNSYFARIGGISTVDLNKMEVEFLFLMGFKLHVNVSVFESYCSHLEREVGFGGGYQIEKALRCAVQIKSNQLAAKDETTHPHHLQITRLMSS